MIGEFSKTMDWRAILAGMGLAVAAVSLAAFFLPAVFVGVGSSLLGVGEWINARGRTPRGLRLGERRFRHAVTLQRLGKAVAIVGGVVLAEGMVKMFA